jgi:hypothetical protein
MKMNKDGIEFVIPGVDAKSPTGAHGVHEHVGLRKLRAVLALDKKV